VILSRSRLPRCRRTFIWPARSGSVITRASPVIPPCLVGVSINARSPFDGLRVSGKSSMKSGRDPLVLSSSKHERGENRQSLVLLCTAVSRVPSSVLGASAARCREDPLPPPFPVGVGILSRQRVGQRHLTAAGASP
jgi:hypothetical protein